MYATHFILAAVSAIPVIAMAQRATTSMDSNMAVAQMSGSMAEMSSSMEMMKTADLAPTSTMSIARGMASSMNAIMSSMNKMPKATAGSEMSAQMKNMSSSMEMLMTSSAEMMGGMTATKTHNSSMTTMKGGKGKTGDSQATSTNGTTTTISDPTASAQANAGNTTISAQNNTNAGGKLPIPGLFRLVNQAVGINGRI